MCIRKILLFGNYLPNYKKKHFSILKIILGGNFQIFINNIFEFFILFFVNSTKSQIRKKSVINFISKNCTPK